MVRKHIVACQAHPALVKIGLVLARLLHFNSLVCLHLVKFLHTPCVCHKHLKGYRPCFVAAWSHGSFVEIPPRWHTATYIKISIFYMKLYPIKYKIYLMQLSISDWSPEWFPQPSSSSSHAKTLWLNIKIHTNSTFIVIMWIYSLGFSVLNVKMWCLSSGVINIQIFDREW